MHIKIGKIYDMKEARMANGSNTGVNDRIEGYGQVLCHLINS